MHKLLETRNRLASTLSPGATSTGFLPSAPGRSDQPPCRLVRSGSVLVFEKILGAVLKQGVYLDALPLCLLLRMAGMTF